MISKKPRSENSVVKMKDRCTLGNAVFQSFKKVWLKIDTKIPVDKKLKVYEAQVVSVNLYNASCWAATSAVLINKLDICHRKHPIIYFEEGVDTE